MVFSYLDYFGPTSPTTSLGLRGVSKVDELKELYKAGKVSDVEVKEYLYDRLITTFAPARAAYVELKSNPKRIKAILKEGQEKAFKVATQTMKDVRDAIGVSTSYSFFEYPRVDSDVVTIDDFAKLDLTVGRVISASHKREVIA